MESVAINANACAMTTDELPKDEDQKQPTSEVTVACPDCAGTGQVTVSEVLSQRITLGLTQRELADALGVYQATVAKWEAGRHRPHRVYRDKLADLVRRKERK